MEVPQGTTLPSLFPDVSWACTTMRNTDYTFNKYLLNE